MDDKYKKVIDKTKEAADANGLSIEEFTVMHQAQHCTQIQLLEETVATMAKALQVLSTALQRKGVLNQADLEAEFAAIDKAQETQENWN